MVDEIKLIPNPDRPPEEEIIKADQFLKENDGLQRNPFNTSSELALKIKAARKIMQKARLPKDIDITLRNDIPIPEYFSKQDDYIYLFSDNSLRIKYLNEYPESRYKGKYAGKKYQESHISFYNRQALIRPIGVFQDPLDVFLLGYWAFENVADRLPMDYKYKP